MKGKMNNVGGKKGALGKKQPVGPFKAVGYTPHPKKSHDRKAMPLDKVLGG